MRITQLWPKAILALLIFIGSLSYAQAQTGTIAGVVRDDNGPVPNASVTVEGKGTGTTTNERGEYTLKVAPGTYTLVISYVGARNQRVPVTVSAGQTTDAGMTQLVAGNQLEGVMIVGSRSTVPRTNVETAVPVDVITARDLVTTGQVEPTQMLAFIAPSFNSSRQTIADGTDHIDPATIRGLGPDQVLVLVNGRRRHNTALINVNGTIGRGSVGTDLNSIPPSAIERIEVLRDGAAAQYGSDAIAGVVNVVLKKNIGKTTVSLHSGQQYEGDGFVYNVGVNKGFKMGKRGYLNLSGDFRHRDPTYRAGYYTGTVYTNNVQQDEQLIAANGFSRYNNMAVGNSKLDNIGGVISGGATVGRKGTTNIFFTGSLNHRNGEAAGFYRYPKQTTQVIAQLYPNGFLPEIHSTINDRSFLAGVEGKMANGWNWDVSNTYGGNSFRFDIKNTNNASQFPLGANAPTEFYAGTLKFNQNTVDVNFSKDLGKSMNLQTFNLGLGAEYRLDNYQIEAGEEGSYRNYNPPPSSNNAGGAQVFPGFQPANEVNENRSVYAVYADVESDLSNKFLVNVAARYEYYSDNGSNIAGKLAMRYKFSDKFGLRGAVSNGFRAPSVHQRYFSAISTVFVNTVNGFVPLQQGTFRNNSEIAAAFGIPSLKAEKSTNFSAGFTSKPARNISVTVDGYMIDIKDRIVLTGSFTKSNPTVNQILAAYPDVNSAVFFTNAISTRTTGVDIVTNADLRMNKGNLNITLAGNLNKTEVRGNVQTTDKLPADSLNTNTLFNIEERGRLEQGQPRDKFSLMLNYRISKINVVLRNTRFGKVASIFNGIDRSRDEFFSAKIITDLAVSYKPKEFMQITLGANNLTDNYPDKQKNFANTNNGIFVYSRNSTQFGFNGGYYYANLTFNF